MAIFRIYNIQLLPLDTRKTNEVGSIGYKKLFELYRDSLRRFVDAKKVVEYSDKLVNDTFICPFTIHPTPNGHYTFGQFLKFHKASTVQDLYTKQTLFTADDKSSAVSSVYSFRFVFDHHNHRFAIEESGQKLPSAMRFKKTLEFFLQPIASEHFKDHVLTVNLVSEDKVLSDVLREAEGFSKVNVKLTFPNGPGLNDTLRELKKNNVHLVEHTESAERNAFMPEVTNYMNSLLEKATDFGEATVSYYKSISKNSKEKWTRLIFKTKNFPRRLNLRQKNNEEDDLFLERVWFWLKNTFDGQS